MVIKIVLARYGIGVWRSPVSSIRFSPDMWRQKNFWSWEYVLTVSISYKFLKIRQFVNSLEQQLKKIGFCWIDKTGKIALQQHGVVRTNCVDCLDRTNVIQGELSLTVCSAQTRKLGLVEPTDEIPQTFIAGIIIKTIITCVHFRYTLITYTIERRLNLAQFHKIQILKLQFDITKFKFGFFAKRQIFN